MHYTTWLLTSMALPINQLAAASPSSQPAHKASQVYDTTDQLPLPNLGNIVAHDPNILLWEDYYYLFHGDVHIPIHRAQNLSGPWESVGTVLSGPSIIDTQNRTRPWAPTTIEANGTFYCYYTLSEHGSRNSAIGVATTTSLDGSETWTDHGAVIRTGHGNGSDIYPFTITNAIDASFITDNATGQSYLNYGSFWHDIWQVPLSDDLLSLRDPDNPDAVQLTFVPDSDWKPEEGSWMSYRDGYYYAWFSHGKCCNFKLAFPARGDEYEIRVGRSTNVRGPFEDKDGKKLVDGGGTVIYASNHGVVYAPGGLGVLAGNGSTPDVLYYHYLNTSIGFTDTDAHMGWNYLNYTDGWPVVVDGIDLSASNAAFTLSVPNWLVLMMTLSFWLCT
ncbi:hypothetical protein N7466_005787 [Penicillium verhagenii]|uniref:uncharacterized protein n=1 Tax=Penicillium verhagenii TaxID=1562060 RepID=UPI00254559A5|nr:uncharacterized protein N7466_005787 [Penicillium verhagenii]KAJ5930294.1 hypothetical protein N7466_005787 [Penicillium verhagenii]